MSIGQAIAAGQVRGKPPRHWARMTLTMLSVIFMAGLAGEFFLAGAGAFGASSFGAHAGLGALLLVVSLVLAAVAVAGRQPRRVTGLTGLLLGAMIVQVALAGFRGANALVAALHPVNALVVYSLAVVLARRARQAP